ncbi:AbrB/MazE/SpoVT family DNA-binding domain-containing protein [Desulfomicrobium baculatum]|jgi:antitoxin MazE|uniref:Transcriptional regulator/antitoxin, MazE n=1 Tax=Desulfomicrobium baculatum (strain DSM 4028 / VKM B-1378 / X) TaxID=525897 RepID=C7LS70_DESBD|nr:AbrB/MazE/SpoVT family DNA-binding domain-containing protein [Desulfomicrobium baculatum]ACU90618.1 transcriptional regulator/antitoxin, MazE [Desulfomicrobium baculatum DSM 4028]
MEAKTVKWGNSLALRIPNSIVKDCGLSENSLVDISFRKGEIVIKPMRGRYALSELLAGITPENVHGEAFMDEPVGQELL